MKVLAFGEILWDVINGTEHLGGAPFNFAAHAAQCGNESFIVSRLGSDFLGMRAFNLSKKHGVDVSFIQWDEIYPTGIVDVSLVNGQPDYIIRENAAYDHIESGPVLSASTQQPFDVFYFGSLAQRNVISSHALFRILSSNKFKHVFYDVNLRKNSYTEDIVRKSLAACSIFKLNVDEVNVISDILTGNSLGLEEFCRCVKALFPNVQLVVITASEKGCYIFDNNLIAVPGKAVKVRDAVGAGDAFSASFMHVYALTGDPVLAAQIANQVGAFVATQDGAIPSYSKEITTLLENVNKTHNAPLSIL